LRPDSGAIVNAAGTRTTYTWDMADRLTGIALSGGGLITMLYSATGLRRVRQDGSGTVKYLWDGQSPLMETDGDGTTTARYTGATDPYGPVVSQRRGNTSRFFHPNDLGTFDKVTDADAATTDTYILDAWGVQHAATGSTVNPFRYIGALGYYTEPDLGLHYVRARWLRPATGSWLSVDPVEGQQRYGYVGGRATWGVDPSGLIGAQECNRRRALCQYVYEVEMAYANAWYAKCKADYPGFPVSRKKWDAKCFQEYRKMQDWAISQFEDCLARIPPCTVRESALEIAEDLLNQGVGEDPDLGPNQGELINKWGEQFPGSWWPGDEWCAVFAYECYKEGGFDVPPYVEKCGPLSHAYGWHCWGAPHGYVHPSDGYTPEPGDLLILIGPQPDPWKAYRHIGIVKSVDPEAGTITTIEGNVGDAVASKTRRIDEPGEYIHVPY